MIKNVNIFEFPSNMGLIKKEHEAEPCVRKLPGWLRKFGFHPRIHPRNTIWLVAGLGYKRLTYTNDLKPHFSEEKYILCRQQNGNGIDDPDLILSPLIYHENVLGPKLQFRILTMTKMAIIQRF